MPDRELCCLGLSLHLYSAHSSFLTDLPWEHCASRPLGLSGPVSLLKKKKKKKKNLQEKDL